LATSVPGGPGDRLGGSAEGQGAVPLRWVRPDSWLCRAGQHPVQDFGPGRRAVGGASAAGRAREAGPRLRSPAAKKRQAAHTCAGTPALGRV